MNLHKNQRKTRCWRASAPRSTANSLLVAGGLIAGILLALTATASAQGTNLQQGGDRDAMVFSSSSLRVNVWHDKDSEDVYRRGEPVRVYFETNADAYAVVYQINAEGKVAVLWPLSRYDDGFVFGNHLYQLPVQGAPQLLAANEEGVAYVEAIVSSYPFDLRILELDFHHEQGDEHYEFWAAGDPFLAMNEVNYNVTGLENASDYVVTNYTSYYVHRQVDHPRYLCHQCHDYDQYRPYADSCSLNIRYDFGWYNSWWVGFGYYPLYTYPAWYYVDPWTWRPWVNYWYTPVYVWPGYPCYTWSTTCYNWRYSPIYRGDVHERYRDGDRRYRPLTRDLASNGRMRDSYYDRESLMVRSDRPSRDMESAMRSRTRSPGDGGTDLAARDDRAGSTGRTKASDRNARPELTGGAGGAGSARNDGRYVNTAPATRDRVAFKEDRNVRSAPGLRVPGRSGQDPGRRPVIRDRNQRSTERDATGSSLARNGTRDSQDSGRRTPTRLGPRADHQARTGQEPAVRERSERTRIKPQGSDRSSRRTLRSVEPRKGSSRIWTGGRSSAAKDRTARPKQYDSGSKRQGSEAGRSRSSGVRSRSSADKPQSGKSSSRTSGIKSRSSSNNKSSGGTSGRSTSIRKPSNSGKSASSTRSAPTRKSGGSRSGGSRRR